MSGDGHQHGAPRADAVFPRCPVGKIQAALARPGVRRRFFPDAAPHRRGARRRRHRRRRLRRAVDGYRAEQARSRSQGRRSRAEFLRCRGVWAQQRHRHVVWWSKIRALEKVAGKDEAVRLARASEAAIGELGAFCARHCQEARFHKGGWAWVATSPAHVGAWEDVVRRCSGLDDSPPFTTLSAQDLASRTGTTVHLGGVFDSTAATVHPGFLVRGLRQTALDLGVHIYEKTRVGAIAWNRPAVLSSGEGRVVADKVVIATNVWAAGGSPACAAGCR